MATFNGEKYIENQILSIISQTYTQWRLIVHDDGSTDKTIEIIKRYSEFDKRIILIEDGIIFGNVTENFMHLVSYSEMDYSIFCDQDDIWFEQKLEFLYNGLVSEDHIPCAVFCNGYAYSRQEGIINNRITNVFPTSLKEQLFLNAGIQGCSLMFNKKLREIVINTPRYIAMHDHLITLAAISFGKLKYVDKSLMLYRQFHENKVTANINYSRINRIRSVFFSEIPVVDYKHFLATRSFFAKYETRFAPEQRLLFNAYFNYVKSDSLIERVLIILTNGFSLYKSQFLLILKTITRKKTNKCS